MEQKQSEKWAAIDWTEVHRRLEAARQKVEQGWKPSAQEKSNILKERAKALAIESVTEGEAEDRIDLLEFKVSSECYGFELKFVREVCPLKELTPLPCAPQFVIGVINVRGQIIPVNDIRGIFGLPQKGLTELDKVIILKDEDMELGVLADAVIGVGSVPVSGIQPPPPTLTGIREEYLRGVTGDRLVLLDAGKMLSGGKLIVHEEVL